MIEIREKSSGSPLTYLVSSLNRYFDWVNSKRSTTSRLHNFGFESLPRGCHRLATGDSFTNLIIRSNSLTTYLIKSAARSHDGNGYNSINQMLCGQGKNIPMCNNVIATGLIGQRTRATSWKHQI